jgi:hypothetical protein
MEHKPDAKAFQDFIEGILLDPNERTAYLRNPDMAMNRPAGAIPTHIRETLADLSSRELRLIADINSKVCEGNYIDIKDIVCIV